MDAGVAVRRALLGLLALIGANALVAGALLVARPDGSLLGLPQDDLADTPFRSFLVPGLLLLAMGCAHAGAFVLHLRRHPRAWLAAGFAAGYLVVWIAVQTTMIQWSFLQPLLFTLGAVEGLLALAQWRLSAAAAAPRRPEGPGR